MGLAQVSLSRNATKKEKEGEKKPTKVLPPTLLPLGTATKTTTTTTSPSPSPSPPPPLTLKLCDESGRHNCLAIVDTGTSFLGIPAKKLPKMLEFITQGQQNCQAQKSKLTGT